MEIAGFNLSFEEVKKFLFLKDGDFFILHGKNNKDFDYRFDGYMEKAQDEMHIFIKLPNSSYCEDKKTIPEFNAIDLDTQELLYMPIFASVRQIHGYIKCKNSDSEDEFLEEKTFIESIGLDYKSIYAHKDFKPKVDDCDKMWIPIQLNNFTHKESGTRIPYLRLGVALHYKICCNSHKWWDTIISTTKNKMNEISGFEQYWGRGKYRYRAYDLDETGRIRNELIQKIWF